MSKLHSPNCIFDIRYIEVSVFEILRVDLLSCLLAARAPEINLCVHPKSLQRQVVEQSRRHVSSGSTVKTFLTQHELVSFNDYEPSLPDISENDISEVDISEGD